MKQVFSLFLILQIGLNVFSQQWKGKWITAAGINNKPNTWVAFRKEFFIDDSTIKLPLRIAADTKYWLWVNNKLVVYEGGLKRGPTPDDTYCDSLDVAGYLVKGTNSIGVLLWYFGKEGFSHKNSGKAGILIDCPSNHADVSSSEKWEAMGMDAYQTADDPSPNFRLAESNIRYDARIEKLNWQSRAATPMQKAVEIGNAGDAPWNQLIGRPIPFFKNLGIRDYVSMSVINAGSMFTYEGKLPYNCQVHPVLKVKTSTPGLKIKVFTDIFMFLGEPTIRGEFITKAGEQEFEFPGWMNGEKVIYQIPKGIEVIKLQYRESSFDAEAEGEFNSDDAMLDQVWKKGQRTLLLSMRDNYMDCPDRERAAWTGDIVSQTAQSFYSLSISSHTLSKKWLSELSGWVKPNGEFSSPVPAGNADLEIPDQTLTTFGLQGVWNYYMNTGDAESLKRLFPQVDRNLTFWEYDANGLINVRVSGNRWIWGDRGNRIDMKGLYNMLYAGVLSSMAKIAGVINKPQKADEYLMKFNALKAAIRRHMLVGTGFKSDEVNYYDERVQAFAMLNGIAEVGDHAGLMSIINTGFNASPYMEQFIIQAMMKSGLIEEGLARIKKRYGPMAEDKNWSTLWEGWSVPNDEFGGTTPNHAWSGGAVYLLPMYVHGIMPVSAGYGRISIKPLDGSIKNSSVRVPSILGLIQSSFNYGANSLGVNVDLPSKVVAVLELPRRYSQVLLNGALIMKHGSFTDQGLKFAVWDSDTSSVKIVLTGGNWKIEATNDLNYPSPFEITGFENKSQQLCLKTNQVLSARLLMLSSLVSKTDFRGKVRWYHNDVLSANDTIGFIYPDKIGSYRVAIIAENGGTVHTGTIQLYAVEKPLVNNKSYFLCKNSQSTKLEATASSGNSLAWYNFNLQSLGVQSPQPSTSFTGITSFHVAQVDGYGCTSDTVSIAVWVRENPPAPQVTTMSYCQYQNANPLNASSGFGQVVKWVDTVTNLPLADIIKPIPSTQLPGLFKFNCFALDTLTGCFSSASTLVVAVHQKPLKPTLDSILICEGAVPGSKTLNNFSGHAYNWYHLDQKPIITSNNTVEVSTINPGTFKFLLSRLDMTTQCESDLSSVVVSVIPLPPKPMLEQRSPGRLSLVPSLEAVWYRNNELIKSYIGSSLSVSLPGVYSASLIAKGCIGETSKIFHYLTSNLMLGPSNRLIIYPNPVQSYLNIELPLPLSPNGNLILFNSSGQLVKMVRGISNRALINLSDLTHGIYYLTTYSNGKLMYKVKFIKE